VSDNDAADLPTHSDSVRIGAPPATVWQLVTAMERYGEWSSENTGGRWRKGGDGEEGTGKVGDQFVGINRRAGTEWKALVEVVERDEGRSYGFVTGGTEMNLALWRYRLEPDGEGTLLTEQWTMRNPDFFRKQGGDAEIAQRTANAKESIAATLAGMKATAESAT
jgi:Polyketide cyclase / dehydrase and lipid transport